MILKAERHRSAGLFFVRVVFSCHRQSHDGESHGDHTFLPLLSISLNCHSRSVASDLNDTVPPHGLMLPFSVLLLVLCNSILAGGVNGPMLI